MVDNEIEDENNASENGTGDEKFIRYDIIRRCLPFSLSINCGNQWTDFYMIMASVMKELSYYGIQNKSLTFNSWLKIEKIKICATTFKQGIRKH